MDVHAAEYVGPRPFEACSPLLLRPSETRCPQLRRYPRSKSTSFVTAGLPFHFISQCDPRSTLTRYTLSTTWKFVSYSMLQHRMESQNPREAAPSHHFAGRDPPLRRDKAVLSSQVSLASVHSPSTTPRVPWRYAYQKPTRPCVFVNDTLTPKSFSLLIGPY